MVQDFNDRQADATGLVESARRATGQRPYLGDQHVIDGLVRALAGEVIDRIVQASEGEITQDEAVRRDQEACHQLARTLIGENPDYTPIPGWSEYGLANSIRRKQTKPTHDEDNVLVIAQAAAMFIHYVYQAVREADAGGEQALQDELSELARSFTWLLLGIHSYE